MNGLKQLLADLAREQAEAVARWHEAEPDPGEVMAPAPAGARGAQGLRELVMRQHLANYLLWHVEDSARRRDVGDEVIADCKRTIDRLNQRRNDLIEAVDDRLVELMLPLMPALPNEGARRYNTETAGSVLDRLSIFSLKMYHMEEQARREDADEALRAECRGKLEVLARQRSDLLASLLDLLDEYARGEKHPRVFRQFKMYNDPRLNPEIYGRPGAGAE